MIHLQPLYVTVTKNFSWENIASDNYIPLVYQYSYGDTSGNNSINSAIMALLCSKNDTFEDVADAVYPVQILYFLCVNYVYTDVNKISSYTAREIINDYIIGYKAGLKYRKTNTDASSDLHVFEGFIDEKGNTIKLTDKVATKSSGLIKGAYAISSKDIAYEDDKKQILENLSKK